MLCLGYSIDEIIARTMKMNVVDLLDNDKTKKAMFETLNTLLESDVFKKNKIKVIAYIAFESFIKPFLTKLIKSKVSNLFSWVGEQVPKPIKQSWIGNLFSLGWDWLKRKISSPIIKWGTK